MKNFAVRKPVSIFDLTREQPIYKTEYIGDGKYKAKQVGTEPVPLVERGEVGIGAFFTARKTSLKKLMWGIWRARRTRVGQLKLL